jgi:penicillin amidase
MVSRLIVNVSMKKLSLSGKWCKKSLRALLALAGMVGIVIIAAEWLINSSLPLLSGHLTLIGLESPVWVERDARGVPLIKGRSREDIARAMGFVHAQDRFFQMDLLRRTAAGELSELFGSSTLERDCSVRVFQFRKRAEAILRDLHQDDLRLLEAYSEGVNSGLSYQSLPPLEYLLLGVSPRKWVPSDTLLVMFAFYLELQDSRGWREQCMETMRGNLPWAVVRFLVENEGPWTSALDGSQRAEVPIPPPGDFSYLTGSGNGRSMPRLMEEGQPPAASNGVVITRTKSGVPILANDLHLSLNVPNVWYQMAAQYISADAQPIEVVGATLPGCPLFIIGSNRFLAWGVTNSMLDTSDLKVISRVVPISKETETIRVKGKPSVELPVKLTAWGPVVAESRDGHPLALFWSAEDSKALNLNLMALETIHTVKDALVAKKKIGLPLLNLLLADSKGGAVWTLMGSWIDRASGYNGEFPSNGESGFGKVRIRLDPPLVFSFLGDSGAIWNGNNRPLSPERMAVIGEGGFDNGSRALQIHNQLSGKQLFSEQMALGVLRDDRALFLARWQRLLLDLLRRKAQSIPQAGEVGRCVKGWGGRASTDSAGYHLIRRFRDAVADRVFSRLLAPCYNAYDEFSFRSFDFEEPLWLLVTRQPEYLVDPSLGSWDKELLLALNDAVDFMRKYWGKDRPLDSITWGKRNTLDIRHPLSKNLPKFIRLLDMPREEVGGDENMPMVTGPTYGASLRMVVSPGRESSGIFEMPGGQSGNPFSPYYRTALQGWVDGAPDSLLPGAAVNRLKLIPCSK